MPKKNINNLPHLIKYRKKLRKNLTPAEASLWLSLKNKQVLGKRFRRQFSVGNYILDFYCVSDKLAIELDGEAHNNVIANEHDFKRDEFLKSEGITVLRFENKAIFQNLTQVIMEIESCLVK